MPARAVLVSGGGSGIGAATARLLAGAGHQVAICGRRPEPLRGVAAETGALDLVCDVADAEQVSRPAGHGDREFGRLDGLVLNAGIIVPGGVADLAPQDLLAMVSVNLTGAFQLAQAALPHLIGRAGRSCPSRRWRRCGPRPAWAATRRRRPAWPC